MRVVILGSQGMLGREVTRMFQANNEFEVIPLTRNDLDITQLMDVKVRLFELQPDIIINAAAFTNVEAAENDKDMANLVNGDAVRYLAEAAVDTDALLVHYSTDYVFDGKEKSGYPEYYPRLRPINAYGYSKALGETSISKIQKLFKESKPLRYYLIRTSWVFGEHGKNFVDTMLHLASNQPEISVVCDQEGCPTFAPDLAKRTFDIIRNKSPYGIYHVTNAGKCTWHNFAEKIFELSNKPVMVKAITSDQFPTQAQRPQYGVLVNSKLPPMRSWEEALAAYLTESKKLREKGLL